jgi:hypothetical protein
MILHGGGVSIRLLAAAQLRHMLRLMPVISEAPDIPGAVNVIAWFGHWPTFHDAEVLSIWLDRTAGCLVAVHAFSKTAETDASGHFVLDKHAVVTFVLEGFPQDSSGIVNTNIAGFNHQNVLSGLTVNRNGDWYELSLEGIYGVDGVISATQMRIEIAPGIPTDRLAT